MTKILILSYLFINKYGFKDQIKRYVLINLLPKPIWLYIGVKLYFYNIHLQYYKKIFEDINILTIK